MLKINHIVRQSETALNIYFDEIDGSDFSLHIALFSEHLRGCLAGVVEVIPCSRSLFIEFNILKSSHEEIENQVRQQVINFRTDEITSLNRELLELPIYYHPEVAPDLLSLAERKMLSVDDVIRIHSETSYTVSSLGFAPGFAYLSGMDSRLEVPRLDSPRQVAKGSLGIAGLQSAIYPQASPGGWVIIGNCPVSLFDIDADPITLFKVGMKVRFNPITREEFLAKGGVL